MAIVQEFKQTRVNGGDAQPVHSEPCLHIKREYRGPLKGWSTFYQPVPAPRLILTPYVGCVSRCEFCFLRAFPGLHRLGTEEMIVTVYSNYVEHFKNSLDQLRIAPPVIISPFTDPFQPVNDRYGLSEKLVQVAVLNNLPVEIITRHALPDEVLAMLEYLPDSRIQVSVDPLQREGETASLERRLDSLEKVRRLGISAILRLDPLTPGIPGLNAGMERIIAAAADRNIGHIVTRFIQVPPVLHESYVRPYQDFYQVDPDHKNWWIVVEQVRRQIITRLKKLTDSYSLTLGLLEDPRLHSEFGSFETIFPRPIPISQRSSSGEIFSPVTGCPGDCLLCETAPCGIDELAEQPWRQRRLSLVDWKRWSSNRLQGELL